MTVRIAKVLSFIFHPLLLTTYLVLFLGRWVPQLLLIRQEHLLSFTVFIFGTTFVFPALNLLMFRRFGVLTSLTMTTRHERILPFVFNSILYVLIVVLFIYNGHLSVHFTKVMMIVASLAVVATVITFFFKISVHSLSWAGFIGIVLPLNNAVEETLFVQIMALILVTGIVMSARLKLNAHTVTEVMMGAVVGFAIGYGGMNYLF